jgi:hypothetical protein
MGEGVRVGDTLHGGGGCSGVLGWRGMFGNLFSIKLCIITCDGS